VVFGASIPAKVGIASDGCELTADQKRAIWSGVRVPRVLPESRENQLSEMLMLQVYLCRMRNQKLGPESEGHQEDKGVTGVSEQYMTAEVAGWIAKKFSEGTASAIKLTFQLGGPKILTGAQIMQMQEMAARGERSGALKIAIKALQRRFSG
jgi:hypothetical protein